MRTDSGREANLPRSALGDAGELLDTRAKGAYRRRLAEIDDDIEQAQGTGDTERIAQADTERGFLIREFAHAFGSVAGVGERRRHPNAPAPVRPAPCATR